MELKDFQRRVLAKLEVYLTTLASCRANDLAVAENLHKAGLKYKRGDWCEDAWEDIRSGDGVPPKYVKGIPHNSTWVQRIDGTGESIPHVCLKLPTGGGKTLIASAAIERIGAHFVGSQTGFVLWIVPSDAIYKQTWKSLTNREHPYRQILGRASGGRVKLLEKGDTFTDKDVDSHLCIMLLMLQSSNKENKESLRIFRDSGRFTSFYPDEDDGSAIRALKGTVPNLDLNDEGNLGTISVKMSLGNTLRIIRPIVVLDEGHKAYSDLAMSTLCGFNPRFVLELSATPDPNRSNILVDVSGTELRDAEMVKLPIEITNFPNSDWKYTLQQANLHFAKLSERAQQLADYESRYIRPIMIVRVERTGKDQRDGKYVHAEDARHYLVTGLGVSNEQIRLKTSEKDDIGDEDLLDPASNVRYIITKDALREGWDCPFAYSLVFLASSSAKTAITQMVGRVLRQPDAKLTPMEELNTCYVFCFDQKTKTAIEGVRNGLEQEGMGDAAHFIREGTTFLNPSRLIKKEVSRRNSFKVTLISLPKILFSSSGVVRPLDYERDILPRIPWSTLRFTHAHEILLDGAVGVQRETKSITVRKGAFPGAEVFPFSDAIVWKQLEDSGKLDEAIFARMLADTVPNPWEALRIVREVLSTLRQRSDVDEGLILRNRFRLLEEIRKDLKVSIDLLAENVFMEMLELEEVKFELVVEEDPTLYWSMPESYEEWIEPRVTKQMRRDDDEPLQRSLFDPVYERNYNELEMKVALYTDERDQIAWWHRLAAMRDYGLQGWRDQRVYPDFLVCMQTDSEGASKYVLLESKGDHLEGNDDTNYKSRLFDRLNEYRRDIVEVGTLALATRDNLKISMKLIRQKSWESDLLEVFANTPI